MQENLAEITKRDATLVALSSDTQEVGRELAAKLSLTFPLLSDPDRKVIRDYGVEDAENEISWPALFVIGPGGKIQKRLMLETYKERPLPSEILGALSK